MDWRIRPIAVPCNPAIVVGSNTNPYTRTSQLHISIQLFPKRKRVGLILEELGASACRGLRLSMLLIPTHFRWLKLVRQWVHAATENTNDLSPIHTADNRRVASCDRKKNKFSTTFSAVWRDPWGRFPSFPPSILVWWFCGHSHVFRISSKSVQVWGVITERAFKVIAI